MKNKIRGMLYGVAIGDALGQPYEMQKPLGEPVKTYPELGGQTTDDWSLTAAMARALIKADGFDMSAMVTEHVAAYEAGTRGWGGAHRNACKLLKEGISPMLTGKMALDPWKPYRGRGNGMCMKVSPLAAYYVVTETSLADRMSQLGSLTIMTHATGIGLSSAVGMTTALINCLKQEPDTIDIDKFLTEIEYACSMAERCVENETEYLNLVGNLMSERVAELRGNWRNLTPEDVIASYKGGGYVYESFPFSLAFFCMGRHDAGCVYDVVGSGGDTDTNGSMVAAMVGALHGEEIFSKSLLYKLLGFPDIELLTAQFADWCDGKKN